MDLIGGSIVAGKSRGITEFRFRYTDGIFRGYALYDTFFEFENIHRGAISGLKESDGGGRSVSNDNPPLRSGFFSRGCPRSEEHTSELQSRGHLVFRILLD